MATKDLLKDLVLEDDNHQRLARALDMGGLPTDAEVQDAFLSLQTAHDTLERLVWRVEGVASADGVALQPEDLPAGVSFEDIGRVAVIADDAECHAEEVTAFARRLRDARSALAALRDARSVLAGVRSGVPGGSAS